LLAIAQRRFKIWSYTALFFLCLQFVMFARLTWWDYSWDVIEPFTYFTNVVQTAIAAYVFYLFKKEEYSNELGRNIYVKRKFKKLARYHNLDEQRYQELKAKVEEIEKLNVLFEAEARKNEEEHNENRNETPNQSPQTN